MTRAPNGEPERFLKEEVLSYTGNECLLWPYARFSNGYGKLRQNEKHSRVHRIVCEVINGPPPAVNYQAAHSCGRGQQGCVTPRHLSWKTPLENSHDKVVHRTMASGSRNGKSKLTENNVKQIRKSSEPLRSLAERFGVTMSTISKVRRQDSWTWLS